MFYNTLELTKLYLYSTDESNCLDNKCLFTSLRIHKYIMLSLRVAI